MARTTSLCLTLTAAVFAIAAVVLAATPVKAEILAMVNYESKKKESLKSLKLKSVLTALTE